MKIQDLNFFKKFKIINVWYAIKPNNPVIKLNLKILNINLDVFKTWANYITKWWRQYIKHSIYTDELFPILYTIW